MAKAGKGLLPIRKQPINRRVIWALVPCIAGSVYYFGWRSLAVVLFAGLVAFVMEHIFCRMRGEQVSEAAFVTSTIFALVMPPTVPWHVVLIGVAFAIMFAKEVFGGFGRNVFNPAMAGRCFVYICFPIALTGTWSPAGEGPIGALAQWSTMYTGQETMATTGASPMGYLKSGQLVVNGQAEDMLREDIPFDISEDETVAIEKTTLLQNQLVGRISGTMGVTSAVLILIGGLYLFWTKTASRAIILSLIITYSLLNAVLHYFGIDPVPMWWSAVLGGGFLFGAFFMATDPVSAPKTLEAKIIYGILIGTFTTVIRNFSIFNGGLMFSILLGNMLAPILDVSVRSYKSARKAAKQAAQGGETA